MTTNDKPAKVADVSAEMVEGALVLTFASGSRLEVLEHELPAEIRAYAMWHGLKQKLVDAAAIPRDPETGLSASPAQKEAAVRAVANRLALGEWNRPATGGNEGGLLVRALLRLYPARTREDLTEWVKGKSKAEQAKLRANPRVAAIIAEIQAASATGIDSDALLGELGA